MASPVPPWYPPQPGQPPQSPPQPATLEEAQAIINTMHEYIVSQKTTPISEPESDDL